MLEGKSKCTINYHIINGMKWVNNPERVTFCSLLNNIDPGTTIFTIRHNVPVPNILNNASNYYPGGLQYCYLKLGPNDAK